MRRKRLRLGIWIGVWGWGPLKGSWGSGLELGAVVGVEDRAGAGAPG